MLHRNSGHRWASSEALARVIQNLCISISPPVSPATASVTFQISLCSLPTGSGGTISWSASNRAIGVCVAGHHKTGAGAAALLSVLRSWPAFRHWSTSRWEPVSGRPQLRLLLSERGPERYSAPIGLQFEPGHSGQPGLYFSRRDGRRYGRELPAADESEYRHGDWHIQLLSRRRHKRSHVSSERQIRADLRRQAGVRLRFRDGSVDVFNLVKLAGQ